MKLVAEILTGRLFYVEVDEESTVGDLKKQIGNQESLPSDRLVLMLDAHDQRDLMNDDDVSLKEYGVQDGSHIYVFFQLVDDGSPHESPSTPPESVLFNESCSTLIGVSNEPDPSEEPENETDPSEEPENEPDPSEEPENEPDPSEESENETDPSEEPANEPDPSEEPENEPDPSEEPANEPDPSEEPKNEPDPSEEPANETDPSEESENESDPSEEQAKETDPSEEPDFPSPSTRDPSDQNDVSPDSPSPSTTDPEFYFRPFLVMEW